MSKRQTIRIASQLQKVIKNTCMLRTGELDQLTRSLTMVYEFLLEARIIDPHLTSVLRKQGSPCYKVSKEEKKCLELANLHNAITDIYFDLWAEFGEAIRSLIVGNYISTHRSLRWIIETTIFWSWVEQEHNDATEHFDFYRQSELPISKERFNYLSKHIVDSYYLEDQIRFRERYSAKNQSIPFSVLLDGAHSFKNESLHIPSEQIKSHYLKLWKQFSTLIHISARSLKEVEKDNPDDYLFFSDNSYDHSKFMLATAKIWETLDLICCTLILYSSNFYGYDLPSALLESLKKHPKSRSGSIRLQNMINRQKHHLRILNSLIQIGDKTQTARMEVGS